MGLGLTRIRKLNEEPGPIEWKNPSLALLRRAPSPRGEGVLIQCFCRRPGSGGTYSVLLLSHRLERFVFSPFAVSPGRGWRTE